LTRGIPIKIVLSA